MRKNLNIIEIRGIRGLLLIGMLICCLAVGFIGFPGWVAMMAWNSVAKFIELLPNINIVQGILLWGMLVASYFMFVKQKFVVCMRTPQGLNEEELKSVFADIKKQAEEDKIIQTMIKAKDAEIKIKNKEENELNNKS